MSKLATRQTATAGRFQDWSAEHRLGAFRFVFFAPRRCLALPKLQTPAMRFELSSRCWPALALVTAVVALRLIGSAPEEAKQDAAQKPPADAPESPLPSPLGARFELTDAKLHRDFPALALDAKGTPWLAFIEHDGQADMLKLARKSAGGLEIV